LEVGADMEMVKYVKVNPNKNTTILVLNKYPRKKYPILAKQLMNPESVYAEQVGFVENPSAPQADAGLYMMGGEFCANAVASLCAYLAYKRDVESGERACFQLEVSGSDSLVSCEVRRCGDGYRIKITMPIPLEIHKRELNYQSKHVEFGFVEYSGNCHVIIPDDSHCERSKKLARHILHREIRKKYATKGVTLFSEIRQSILPLICVEETNTEIWENSCGIASATLAVYLAFKQETDVTIDIEQPSGDFIQAHAAYQDGTIRKVTIEENVFLSSLGIAFV